MRGFLYVLLVAVLVTSATSALAWKMRVHPRCPTNDPSVAWVDYMSAKIPPIRNFRTAFADVQFRYAKRVNDPAAIGNLRTDACYMTAYVPGEGYLSSQTFERNNRARYKERLPGDPSKYEINVYGVLL